MLHFVHCVLHSQILHSEVDKSVSIRILHITETLDGASGVATFVRELDASLRAHGVESSVCTQAEQLRHVDDILHIHGLWLKPYHMAVQWAKANGIQVVWSTHGMTAPWSMRHKWWKKIPAWWLYQKHDLQSAVAIHCTTEQEAEWNKALGFKNCFVVPLGTREISNHVERVEHAEKRLLFVGRIYPVKGLVNLIRAWHILHESTCSTWLKNWKLRIVGPDEAGHKFELESLVQELGLDASVEFPGPKFGDELSQEYENCDCLVLPSFTENFGATIVDAMAHGKPCIASTFTPWKELQDRGCGWWVSNEPNELAAAICEMMSLTDDTRIKIGERCRQLVEEKYTWDAVVTKMAEEYDRILAEGGC